MNLSTLSKQNNTAVKALIYRRDGKLLMQKRDVSQQLPFAGHWTFFGGLTERDENLLKALERELYEELGCIPGEIENEVFQWLWDCDWSSTSNHFFAVRYKEQSETLVQREGETMEWLSLADLVMLPLTPAVYENFSRITEFVCKRSFDPIDKIEKGLLLFNGLKKKNDRVFYAKNNPCGLSRQQMFLLKALASLKSIPVFRVCLHTDDQADVHEMIMIHTQPSSVGPLKQDKTSLSYHIIEGSLEIELHKDSGIVLKNYRLGKQQGSEEGLISLRLNANQYRTVSSSSLFAIFIEVASGPFVDNDTHWLKN